MRPPDNPITKDVLPTDIGRRKYLCAGFTLIELMIASILIALAALAAYHSFRQGILIWKKGQENSHQDKAIMTLERISRELKTTFSFVPVGFGGEETKISFPHLVYKYDWANTVEEMGIEPVSPTAGASIPLPLIAKITYEYNKDDGILSRLQEIYAYPDMEELKNNPNSTKKESSRVILEDVEKITFSYAITKTPELSFTGNISVSDMPYAVKIELKLTTMKDPLARIIFIPINKPPKNEGR